MADASPRERRSFRARLSSYRPLFDRLLFGIALVGVFVAVHLLIQEGRGFDRGCLGFSAPAAVENTFDCKLVTQSRAGRLLGLSNAWWGIGFYLAVAGLSAAAAFTRRRFSFAAARAVLIGGGLLYSAYLTYHQFAGIGALCALCLTSAAVALTLFVVQAVLLARPGGDSAVPSRSSSQRTSSMAASPSARPALWAGAALVLVVLVGADVAYFSNLETGADEPAVAEATATPEAPSDTPGAPARDASAAAAAPARADTTQDGLPAGCRFTPNQPPVQVSRLVGFTDPVFGAADAPVTVAEFFDPNCPHCKEFHPTMQRLMNQYGDRVRFVYKAIPLWRRSVNQIAALHAASRQGKFEEMLDAQFGRQQPGGLTDDQLAGIARQIGMNPGPMLTQIRQNGYQQQIMRDRELAQASGVSGTPAVSINGRLVARRARTPQCVRALIQQALDQQALDSPGRQTTDS